ncbi:MAG TPA: hypothetical protein VEC57_00245 [Candidatus Limnocylindrales bacterium]|nr:hypothetical protein [Candidatus Limnocylindrales bacterium]
MEPHDRAAALFERCKQAGLVGINGDGAPTRDMVAEAILDAGDYSAECSELATYCRRLVRLVRKTDPQNKVAADCVEFLRCIGEAKAINR